MSRRSPAQGGLTFAPRPGQEETGVFSSLLTEGRPLRTTTPFAAVYQCGWAQNGRTHNLAPLAMSDADGSTADPNTSREHEGLRCCHAQGLGGAEHTGVGLISDATRILVINIRTPVQLSFPLRPHGEGPLRVSRLWGRKCGHLTGEFFPKKMRYATTAYTPYHHMEGGLRLAGSDAVGRAGCSGVSVPCLCYVSSIQYASRSPISPAAPDVSLIHPNQFRYQGHRPISFSIPLHHSILHHSFIDHQLLYQSSSPWSTCR